MEARAINFDARGKDYATNILSYASELPEAVLELLPALPLGELVICHAVVVNQTAEQGKTIEQHLTHLLVHGMLHLLGFLTMNLGKLSRWNGSDWNRCPWWVIRCQPLWVKFQLSKSITKSGIGIIYGWHFWQLWQTACQLRCRYFPDLCYHRFYTHFATCPNHTWPVDWRMLDNDVIKDSSQLTPADFAAFYQLILQNPLRKGLRQFVVLTGTDTLSYLAAFLAECFAGSHIQYCGDRGGEDLCLIAMC